MACLDFFEKCSLDRRYTARTFESLLSNCGRGRTASDKIGWIANTNSYIGFWTYTVTAELPQGDYDADLDVDAEDYHVWRAGFGGTTDFSADGDDSGIVDAADYVLWRRNLGQSITLPPRAASILAVPEPESLQLSFTWVALVGLSMMQRTHRRKSA
jgi:hypothetical protein